MTSRKPGADSRYAKKRAVDAPIERWKELGQELRQQRGTLGYRHAIDLARAAGDPMFRRTMLALENGAQDGYMPETLSRAARIYQVTYEQIEAFMLGKTEALTPAAPGSPSSHIDPPDYLPAEYTTPAQRYADAIWQHVGDVAAAVSAATGKPVPPADLTGDQVFGEGTGIWEDPVDAVAWDREAKFGVQFRVWVIARKQAEMAEADRRPDGRGAEAG